MGTNAHAQTITEVRFGALLANPSAIDPNHAESNQFGGAVEVLTREFDLDTRTNRRAGLLDAVIHNYLTPRFHIGGVANQDKNGTSYVYAGVTWRHDLGESVFYESTFGAAINNGSKIATPTRAALGSKLTFRESAALGFHVTESLDMIFQLEHLSHAGIGGSDNRGLTNATLKFGIKF